MRKELQYKAVHYELGLGEHPTMDKPFGSWVLLEKVEDLKCPQILRHLTLKT